MKHAICIATLFAALTNPGYTQPTHPADHSADQPTPAKAASKLADGEVRRIDKDAKKITLRHGPIQSIDMPAMTMVFQVKDATMLDKVNIGDKVKFNAEKIPGGYAVTEIEAVK